MTDWRVRVLSLFTAALALAVPASASGATTIGSTLANPPNAFQGATAFDFTFVNAVNPAPLLASTDGVVVRWRVRDGNHSGDVPVRLRVLVPNSKFTAVIGAGTSATGTLPGSNGASDAMAPILTFPTRLPIAAGSTIGLELNGTGRFKTTGLSSFFYKTAGFPSPAEGGPSPVFGSDPGIEVLLNADVEPDADHDGFGDETQDQCPTNAATQGPCPTATTATGQQAAQIKKCKKKFKGKAKAKNRKKCIKKAKKLPV